MSQVEHKLVIQQSKLNTAKRKVKETLAMIVDRANVCSDRLEFSEDDVYIIQSQIQALQSNVLNLERFVGHAVQALETIKTLESLS